MLHPRAWVAYYLEGLQLCQPQDGLRDTGLLSPAWDLSLPPYTQMGLWKALYPDSAL